MQDMTSLGERIPTTWARAVVDPATFAADQARLAHVWTFLGFTHDLARDGDWITATIATRSVFVQRFGDELRGFENVCAHRFYPLRTAIRGNGPVISSYTDNPKGSMLWLDYWTSKKVIDRGAATYSLPPTLKSSYDEPGVKKALPYSDQLLKAVENATTRPVSPVYSQISEAVYKNVNAAMSGSVSPQDAPTRPKASGAGASCCCKVARNKCLPPVSTRLRSTC